MSRSWDVVVEHDVVMFWVCSFSGLEAQNEVVGEGIAEEGVEPAEETWENTDSTEERMLDVMDDERWRAAWTMLGSAENAAYSIRDSASL